MARGKIAKKDSLLIDESLEKALLPDGEQPYNVPENWVWSYLTTIAECLDKRRKPVNSEEPATRTGEVPYYGATGQVGWIDNFLTSEELVLVGEDGAPFLDYVKDKAYMIAGKAWVNNHAHILKSYFGTYGNKFIMHYLNCFNYKGYVNGTTRLKLTQASMNVLPIPLPPLAEQQRIVDRIVDRIESLFAKLDEAKEKAQAALDSFETRKAAILHGAFTGELTQKWREESGVGLESWEMKTLSSLCNSIFDGDHMPPPKSEVGVPFLVISNVNKGVLSFDSTRFVSKEYYDKLSNTRKPKLNDVLYTIVGSFGIPVLVDDSREFCFQRHMALLKPKSINSKLLWYLLQTQEAYQKASEIATGTAQLTVPIKGLRELSFLIPTLPEQMEIVHILDSLVIKEQNAKELASIIEKIDLMKKAILARAFRGELGTNNPTEESAMGLLKSIILEKIDSDVRSIDKGQVFVNISMVVNKSIVPRPNGFSKSMGNLQRN